jgi:hypothetical protein
MSLNRLLRTAPQWRAALTTTPRFALAAAGGVALVVALVLSAAKAGFPQDVTLPDWWGAWPTGDQARPGWGAVVVAVIGALCVVWMHLARTWLRNGRGVPRLRTILLIALAWAAPFSLTGPIGSLDVQSYAAVGRLAQLGMDPYHNGPAWLHGPYAAAVSPEWQWTPTPYGSLQVALLREVAHAAGDQVGLAVLLIRAVAVVGLAAAVLLAMHAAQATERSSVLLLVALNPLVLVHVVSGAHLDVVVGALAVAVVLLVRRGLPTAAMALAAVACMVKLPGLLLVGYVGLDVLRRTDREALRGRLLQVVGAAAAVLLATAVLVPDAFGWVRAFWVPGTIRSGLAPSTWLSWLLGGVPGGDPQGVAFAVTAGRVLAALAGAVVAARLLWYATEGPERAAYLGVGWGLIVLAFSGPTAYPWYLTWGLFVAAVGSRLRGRIALIGLSVAYVLLGGYSGGLVGVLAMAGAFAVAGTVLWRTHRSLVGRSVPDGALVALGVTA